jgi:AcrR family transcriptional regulator
MADETARPYHHGDLPAALLAAVAELIDEGGLEAVSLRAAARRAGVSHAAPAHHFGDKAGLLTAFALDGFQRFGAALATARDQAEGSGEEVLLAMGRAYLAFTDEHRPHFEVMFRPELVGEHDTEVHAAGAAALAVLADHLAACLEPGVGDEEVFQLALATWSAIHGLAILRTDGVLAHLGVDDEQAAAPVLSMVVTSARAHPAWRGQQPVSA